jgi:hypothetical protein
MIIGTSLVDNFFFYPNFQIFYGVFIALAEMLSEGSNMTQKKSEITKCNNDKEIDIKTNI